MENVISNLVADYEQGKTSRRELIRNLAVALGAASAAGAAATFAAHPAFGATRAPIAAEGKGFKAVTVNHISYQVDDYRKTRDFYSDLLGMPIVQDNGSQCFLTFGDSFLIPRNHAGGTPRIDHIAYTIADWDKSAVEAELRRRGLNPEPDTENSFHVKDPNGFDLQISGKDMKA